MMVSLDICQMGTRDMPAPLIIPTAVAYPTVLTVFPSNWRRPPPEQEKFIPFSINWGNDGGPNNCVLIDIENKSTAPISQVVAIYVNAEGMQHDVQFVFQETQFTLTIPAGSTGLYPVPTVSRRFNVYAPDAASSENVYCVAFNFMPPPVAIESSEVNSLASASAVSLTATATQNLTGSSGILTGIYLAATGLLGGAGGGSVTIDITDAAGNVKFATGIILSAAEASPFVVLANLTGLKVAFVGLLLTITTAGTAFASGGLFVDVYYKPPIQ